MDDTALNRVLAALPPTPSADDYRHIAHQLLPYIQAEVPAMGEGESLERLRFLMQVARRDLGLARIIEGHLDATQILYEARHPLHDESLYGIWASGGPADSTQIDHDSPTGSGKLLGSKPFCSGSDIVDRALVYIYSSEQLIDIDMRSAAAESRLHFEAEHWKAPAFAETHTWTVAFDSLLVRPTQRIGQPRWYFERPGFCLGALAPAACWAGGAFGLVDHVRQQTLKNGHAKAHLGAMVAATTSMRTMLAWGAERIDADPGNDGGHLFPTALLVRHHIERGCADILDRFGRTLGPRPLAFDAENARRVSELSLYMRQCHAESDLEELGVHLEKHPGFP
ncbi:hypothetical protein [Marinobacter fonticola]|uniref:hypothetical protein n=1 Tax=Marinobacter fonticola TaxID=2603215 RepID=UPI0011E6E732|nr:hypothetical protein [Marinobacter fonticola]